MIIDWCAASLEDQREFSDRLRLAIDRWSKFHRNGKMELHRRSGVSRNTIWKFVTRRMELDAEVMQRLCDVLAGWDIPPTPVLDFHDFLKVPGRWKGLVTRTKIGAVWLKRVQLGKSQFSEQQVALILAAYPGMITPSSLPCRPVGVSAARYVPTEQLQVIEGMDHDAPPEF